eukprot:g59554.t1
MLRLGWASSATGPLHARRPRWGSPVGAGLCSLTSSLRVLRMPQLSPSFQTARLLEWHRKEGQQVACYDLLFTCSTGTLVQEESRKGDVEVLVESNDDAILAKIFTLADAQVKAGDVLAVLVEENEHVAAAQLLTVDAKELQTARSLMWQAYKR